MNAFELAGLLEQQRDVKRSYLEFLRVPSLSVGLYTLPAGAVDPQNPHSEDEVYYVVRGKARITVGAEQREVTTGSVIFVAAHAAHRFHDIEEDLTTLVFFAPAEGSAAASAELSD